MAPHKILTDEQELKIDAPSRHRKASGPAGSSTLKIEDKYHDRERKAN